MKRLWILILAAVVAVALYLVKEIELGEEADGERLGSLFELTSRIEVVQTSGFDLEKINAGDEAELERLIDAMDFKVNPEALDELKTQINNPDNWHEVDE